jgi:hypothetical protein
MLEEEMKAQGMDSETIDKMMGEMEKQQEQKTEVK